MEADKSLHKGRLDSGHDSLAGQTERRVHAKQVTGLGQLFPAVLGVEPPEKTR